jgi:DNA-binding NarL/FixJ family response regulator
MIKVLLVDDHKIIRDGIKALLEDDKDVKVVGECDDGSKVVNFLSKRKKVDVILMDITMPGMNGIEATHEAITHHPDVKVIALTMHNEEGYISKILKAGALGYVLKNTGKQELLQAIKTVNSNGNYFGKEVAEIMMSKYMRQIPKNRNIKRIASLDDLTKRELQVLKLIALENTNRTIAKKLVISPRTVDTHRRNILQKLGVKNMAGLVKFAYQNGLLD